MKFKNRYRIVTDKFCGYTCQVKRWWFPVWCSIGGEYSLYSCTYTSIEQAEAWIKKYANLGKMVKEVQP